MSRLSKQSIHASIQQDSGFKHYMSVYNTLIDMIIHHIQLVRQLPPSFVLELFNNSVLTCNQKTQRIVSFNIVKLKTALFHLQKNELFVYASMLREFVDNTEVRIIVFTNVLRIQILQSLVSFIEQSSYTKKDFLILPYTVKSKQRQNILVLSTHLLPTVQQCLFCEWTSDSSSVRRNSLLFSPFLASNFASNDLTVFTTVKTLLRWFCVSRSQHRGIIRPDEPGFKMYHYLPLMLSCFSIRRELSKYHTRKFISSSNKKIDNTTPNFLRGLKSFLQLKNEHFTDLKSIQAIHNYIHSRAYLQSIFPQVWDITNHILFKTKRRNKVSLNDSFLLNNQALPSYMFIYGMMLHKNVPKKIKQMIWLNTYTTTPMVLPSKLKGIEQMQRHKLLYKSYDKFVQYNNEDEDFKPMTEFLQLMVCLEYRSYMNPSKSSFKVSNIPSIRLNNKPSGFPLVAKDKAKTTQDIECTNYVYSTNAWVIRSIELPEFFVCKRDFLLDELLFQNLMNTI